MNTIIFLGGMGAGALVSAVLLIALMILGVRGKGRETAAHMKVTEQLLRERNAIDIQKVQALERMHWPLQRIARHVANKAGGGSAAGDQGPGQGAEACSCDACAGQSQN